MAVLCEHASSESKLYIQILCVAVGHPSTQEGLKHCVRGSYKGESHLFLHFLLKSCFDVAESARPRSPDVARVAAIYCLSSNPLFNLEFNYIDEESVYDIEYAAAAAGQPAWLHSRGFQDRNVIEAEHFDLLLATHHPQDVQEWTCTHGGWTFRFDDVTLHVENDEHTLHTVATSETMPRKVLDPLRVAAREMILGPDDFLWSAMDFMVKLLQLVEDVASRQREWHDQTGHTAATSITKAWDAKEGLAWDRLLHDPHGIDLSNAKDTTAHLLGQPIADICARISEDIRVLHVEPVYRSETVSRHLKLKQQIYADLLTISHSKLRKAVPAKTIRPGSSEDTVHGLAACLSEPSVTFHGAPRHFMESIVRYGFLLPGQQIGKTGKVLEVRCGSTFGRGIYSSPDPMYASAYTTFQSGSMHITKPSDVPGFRLVVCATLMGNPLRVERHEARGADGLLGDNAHSHVSPGGMEYIVFNPAQIIPVYILHLDYGAEHARQQFAQLIASPDNFFEHRRQQKNKNKWAPDKLEESPGDVQRKKDALKAAAMKWFPFGYGTRDGTGFVIEDIAEVSDDEEIYGDFQMQRVVDDDVVEAKIRSGDRNWFDEYQTVRKTNKEIAGRLVGDR